MYIMSFEQKYLKYRNKYLRLKFQIGSSSFFSKKPSVEELIKKIYDDDKGDIKHYFELNDEKIKNDICSSKYNY